MSTQAAVIRVAESLIPLPPEAYPKNLSRTQREDSPETMFPILAYDGQNILPTPYGYRSYFATNEKLIRATVARLLSNVRCENIFWYQSAQLDNVLIALASDGIYITNTDIEADWIKVVDLSALDTVPAERRQWTFCTINNITFMYLQGGTSFYGLVNSARYAEAATPSIITGSTVSQVAQHWNVGVLSYTPTFLAMAGQIGLFKAGNRLGFWDSDGSVSWSSALYVEDFTPSVTTLAGFSKFVDVIGTITKICQHGDGFIIYCTRSIVGVVNNINEKSKFSGRPILSNVGVLFDRQIAVAQPDSLHYVLTSAGLYTITNQQPEVIATDIIDGLVEANDYLCLDYIDGRYLFINTINGWQGSKLDFEGTTNTDFDGNKFTFPPVNYPNPEDASALVDSYLKGLNQNIQDAFKDYEPIVALDSIPPEYVLQPCYDIKIFDSTWAGQTFVPINNGSEILDSKIRLGTTYFLDNLYKEAVVTVNSFSDDNVLPGNFAGQEAYDKMNEGMQNFNKQIDYQNAWLAANQTPYAVDIFVPPSGTNDPEDYTEIVWPEALIERREYPFNIDARDLEASATECRLELYLNKTRLAELLVYFEGIETYTPYGYIYYFQDGGGTVKDVLISDYSGIPNTNTAPKFYLKLPFSTELEAEYDAWKVGFYGVDTGPAKAFGEATLWYMGFCINKHLNKVSAVGIELEQFLNLSTYIMPLPNIIGNVWYPYAYEDIYLSAWFETVDEASWTQDPLSPNPYYISYSGPPTTKPSGWGPFEITGLPGETIILQQNALSFLDNYLFRPGVWTSDEKNEIKNSFLPANNPGYRLQGVISCERELLPSFPQKQTVYALEVSGFGYYPSGGFSFRKTHNRHSSTSCPLPLSGWPSSLPSPPTFEPIDIDIDSETTPPYKWEYPDSISLPPNYWLTKKGSASPLYPTFIRSLIYDTQLEKWGISNMNFKAICAISPVNRTDDTIAPKHDYGMLAAILAPDGSISVLRPNNPQGEICYGKIGQYRLGKTRMAYLKCHFKDKFTGTLIVETSLDGRTVAKELTKAADFTDIVAARFPFTMVGEWFNIKIRGDFALSHIECFIEGRSRR